MMSFVRAGSVVVSLAWALLFSAVAVASAQTNYYAPNGSEYAVVGNLAGDQVFPSVAMSPAGGLLVWQDNVTDGQGWGISARRLDTTASGTLGVFRVNATGTGDQENARVALLKNGGAAFVWQGGVEGYQHIFARFLTPTNTFLTTTDLAVSTFSSSASFQVNPAIAVLNNSNVVVVWASYDQAGPRTLFDVYAKILSPSGATVASEFLVNQFTNANQRTPAVAALAGGGFVVAWVSEQENGSVSSSIDETNGSPVSQIGSSSVDIYARTYQSNGVPVRNEFLVDTGSSPCANPNIAAGSDGGFMVAWSGRDLVNFNNGWDVFARPFNNAGVGGTVVRLNTYLSGNQYAPQLSSLGTDYLAVWTSWGQDGSREGVYGQFLGKNGATVGSEFRVNSTTSGQQMQPTVTSDGVSQFVAVWTSFIGSPYNFDLFAQRYINVASALQPMPAPFVWAPFVTSNGKYQPELVISWAPLLGLSIGSYEVYVDGNGSPTGVVSSNSWTMTAANGLAAGTTHTFLVDYVTTDGRRSPASPPATGAAWSGFNDSGIPFEWMEQYYGDNSADWPANVNAPLASGGLTLYQVFLSGGNPLIPGTWLQQQFITTPQGIFLEWNTQPGATYQVQSAANLAGSPVPWVNLGPPRFAAGTNDAINVGGAGAGYYRVNLLRQ